MIVFVLTCKLVQIWHIVALKEYLNKAQKVKEYPNSYIGVHGARAFRFHSRQHFFFVKRQWRDCWSYKVIKRSMWGEKKNVVRDEKEHTHTHTSSGYCYTQLWATQPDFLFNTEEHKESKREEGRRWERGTHLGPLIDLRLLLSVSFIYTQLYLFRAASAFKRSLPITMHYWRGCRRLLVAPISTSPLLSSFYFPRSLSFLFIFFPFVPPPLFRWPLPLIWSPVSFICLLPSSHPPVISHLPF